MVEILPKTEGVELSHKKGGVGKIVCCSSLSVSVVCVLHFYTISISILCVSEEGLSPVESNQQIYDFYKWIIF